MSDSINTDVEDLGKVPDRVIAERLGCSAAWIAKKRKEKGINPFRQHKVHVVTDPNINWDLVPLGKKSDPQIGKELGVGGHVVLRKRRERKIPPFREYRSKRLKEVPLDVLMKPGGTKELAQQLGYTNKAIINQYRVSIDPSRSNKRVDPEVKKHLIADLDSANIRCLAEKYGISAGTVCNLKKKEGVGKYSVGERVCLCGNKFKAKVDVHIYCSYDCYKSVNELRRFLELTVDDQVDATLFKMLLSIRKRLSPKTKAINWETKIDELFNADIPELCEKYGLQHKSITDRRRMYKQKGMTNETK